MKMLIQFVSSFIEPWLFFFYLLGILFIALRGRKTLIVLIAERLRFSLSTPYSTALKKTRNTRPVKTCFYDQ